jgi:UDP-2,3-diacylglucosamine hydrolase
VVTLFISDLHLDQSRPAATQAFLNFLATEAAAADALYILGDLFEYWIGDDDPDTHNRTIADALATLTSSGVRCYIMHGNRDFMLGGDFIRNSGTVLLHDPTLIYVGNESVLLSHGDVLCTDDLGYQRYRRIVHNPIAQRIYNSVPFSWRKRLVLKIRGASMAKYGMKAPQILDVNQRAVADFMRSYDVLTLLHGHTHRPSIHQFDLDGQIARRIVLGDWYNGSSILRWDTKGPQLQQAAF